MKFRKTAVSIAMVLSGCASLMMADKGAIDPAWAGDHAPGGLSAKAAEKSLKRGGTLLAGNYQVEATLYTNAYLEAKALEDGNARMDSKEKIEKHMALQKRLFTQDKTCWAISLETKNNVIDSGKTKNWVVKYRLGNGEFQDANWDQYSLNSVPNFHVDGYSVGHSAGATTTWYNTGTVCVNHQTKLSDHMELVFIPQVTQDWVKGQKITLSWN